MNRYHLAPVILSLLALPASAAPPHQAAPGRYAITGFRHADFGMTETAARAAIATDFPGATIAAASNTGEGTRLLQVSLPELAPGPGPATVTYIFGARSKALTTVKLAWLLPATATPAARRALLTAGLELAAYFQNRTPRPPVSTTARITGPDAISLYAAADAAHAAVEVAADGVPLGMAGTADPTGPAVLHITYIADVHHPDVAGTAR